jgi:hypothetical protein
VAVQEVAGRVLPGATDVEAVLRMARRARELADQAADAASRARAVEGVEWRSVAAEQFRDALRSCCGQLDACAERLELAAAVLVRHASTAEVRLAAAHAVLENMP